MYHELQLTTQVVNDSEQLVFGTQNGIFKKHPKRCDNVPFYTTYVRTLQN